MLRVYRDNAIWILHINVLFTFYLLKFYTFVDVNIVARCNDINKHYWNDLTFCKMMPNYI